MRKKRRIQLLLKHKGGMLRKGLPLFLCVLCIYSPFACADPQLDEVHKLLESGDYEKASLMIPDELQSDEAITLGYRINKWLFKERLESGNIVAAEKYLEKMKKANKSLSNKYQKQMIRCYKSLITELFKSERWRKCDYYAGELWNCGREVTQIDASSVYFEIADKFYARRRYDLAEKYLKKGLEIRPTGRKLREKLADVYYHTNRLKKAEDIWTQLKGRSGAGKNEPQRFSEEKQVLDKYEIRRISNFDVYFDKGTGSLRLNEISKYLNEAYRSIGRDFHYYPRDKVQVYIYQAEDFADVIGPWHFFVAAQYDGKMRLPAINPHWNKPRRVSSKRFESLVWHEYTHALVHALSGNKAPRWLNEGLAVFEENRVRKEEVYAFDEARKRGRLLTMRELESWGERELTLKQLWLYYEQSHSMVQYMIKRHRTHRARMLLLELRDSNSFGSAFKKIFRTDVDVFYDKWKQSL